uniref:RNA (guanine-9-)-methyltransferase domain-containing protein 1 n=1 Tax=Soboliphyme baturini TaxID=241478 RepID=A0A183J668_9BILA
LLLYLQGIESNRPAEAQSAIIRRYFIDLTQSILIPLEQYVASTMPLKKNMSPWRDPPTVRDFDEKEFMTFIENSMPPLTTGVKGSWTSLYSRIANGLPQWADVMGSRQFSADSATSKMFGDDVPFEDPDIVQWESSLSKQMQEEFSVIKSDYLIYRYADSQVPKHLRVVDCEKLLNMNKADRVKYLTYLFRNEVSDENHKAKQIERQQEIIKHREELRRMREETKHIFYGIGGCFMMRRITDSLISRVDEARLGISEPFNSNIVFDMKPLTELSVIESSLTWLQLRESYFSNRSHCFPFNMHFTDCCMDHMSWRDASRYFVDGLDRYLVNYASDSFIDMFPKDKLIYLSPDSRSMLIDLHPNDVVVIGAMVDKPSRCNWSLARAKQLGIRSARLPIDKFVRWESGSKTLTLNQCVNILLDVSRTGDWTQAFIKNVPQRKLTYKDRPLSKQIRGRKTERLNLLLSLTDQTDRSE